MKSIVIIIDYFGDAFPPWMDLFLESCRWNPSIDWIIHTNCSATASIPPNVSVRQITWGDYLRRVSDKLQITFKPASPYKICDIRPALGVVWKDEIERYEFFGYGDIDVIYGNVRAFYTEAVLARHDVLSTHEWGISGHLCLIRNTPWLRTAFTKIKGWKWRFESPHYTNFDEGHFYRAFFLPGTYSIRRFPALHWMLDWLNPANLKYRGRAYLKEQFTTPLVPSLWRGADVKHSHLWFWQEGRVTNDSNPGREFIYLHFMNFKNARHMDASFGEAAPWARVQRLVEVQAGAAADGFSIGLDGFHPLAGP